MASRQVNKTNIMQFEKKEVKLLLVSINMPVHTENKKKTMKNNVM